MSSPNRSDLVLAIHSQTRGFGFVVLEHLFPVDWGTPEVVGPDREKRCLKHIDALLKLHTPDVVVLQNMTKTGTRRAPRIQAVNRRTLELAKRRGVPVRTYSREEVLGGFGASAPRRSSRSQKPLQNISPCLACMCRRLANPGRPPIRGWASLTRPLSLALICNQAAAFHSVVSQYAAINTGPGRSL